MLALKLLVVPVLLAVVSYAGKRWGPGVAGWLAGFPSLTGPILLFVALEQGAAFTVRASVASLGAVLAAVAFGAAYAWACMRLHWFWSWTIAVAGWAGTVLLLRQMPLSAPVAFALALGTLFVAPRLFPRARTQWGGHALPAQEMLMRMAAGAAMVLVVTRVAAAAGPDWTGSIAVFPVLSSVLAVFSQRANGPGFVVSLLRSMVSGFYALAAYCFSVAMLLEHWGIAATFAFAVAAAVVVQGAARAVIMRSGPPSRRSA